MSTKIEDPIEWCHRHNATVQFHPWHGVTLTVDGYIPQAAYSLTAAINGILRYMEEKKNKKEGD